MKLVGKMAVDRAKYLSGWINANHFLRRKKTVILKICSNYK